MGVAAYSQEKNNLCPKVDLFDSIVNLFYVETKQEQYKDINNKEHLSTKRYYNLDINNSNHVNIVYKLVKYYDYTTIFLYNIGCSDYFIDFIVEQRNLSLPLYDVNNNKHNLMYNLTLLYNSLNRYNVNITGIPKLSISSYDERPLCQSVECFKKYNEYKK